MARVLFVEKQIRNEKLGIMYLSAVLKQAGHTVWLIQSDEEEPLRHATGFAPDFIAYSLISGEERHALATNALLKEHLSFTSVFGGPHATFFPQSLWGQPGVDYVVRGAGESILLQVVAGLLSPGVHRGDLNPCHDDLPFPDRELLYRYGPLRDNPIKNLVTCRDCPYSCSYCYNHRWRQLYRDQRQRLFDRRSPGHVVAEIQQIRQRYPLEQIVFVDDSFIQQPEWVEAFCDHYGREVGLPFFASVRAEQVNDPLVGKLRRAGLTMVNFALESASFEVRRQVLKRGAVTNQQFVEAMAIFKQHGIRVRLQNMIGLPLPNALQDALDTLRFNLDHRVDDSWVSLFQPYESTELADYCRQHGYLDEDHFSSDRHGGFFGDSPLRLADGEKLARLQKWWYFIVHHGLPMEMVEILLELPLTREQQEKLVQLRFAMSRKHYYRLQP